MYVFSCFASVSFCIASLFAAFLMIKSLCYYVVMLSFTPCLSSCFWLCVISICAPIQLTMAWSADVSCLSLVGHRSKHNVTWCFTAPNDVDCLPVNAGGRVNITWGQVWTTRLTSSASMTPICGVDRSIPKVFSQWGRSCGEKVMCMNPTVSHKSLTREKKYTTAVGWGGQYRPVVIHSGGVDWTLGRKMLTRNHLNTNTV